MTIKGQDVLKTFQEDGWWRKLRKVTVTSVKALITVCKNVYPHKYK
jgi:hypothetical protein